MAYRVSPAMERAASSLPPRIHLAKMVWLLRGIEMSARHALLATAALAAWMSMPPSDAQAQQPDCRNRGQLDVLYCDDNNDLVADAPRDPKRWRDPSTLVFAYTPVEDP